MKVQRRDRGFYKLRIEHEDDLYTLNLLLEPGDHVGASTERREAQQADRLRPERTAKKKLRLTLKLEQVEYQPFGQRLRCHGLITKAPRDMGEYHTLLLGPGDDLTLSKAHWLPHQHRWLREAAQPRAVALAVAVESDLLVLAELRSYGLRELKTLRRAGSKRGGGEDQTDFFARGVEQAAEALPAGATLVLIGPGFAKEDFAVAGRAAAPEVFARAAQVNAAQGGLAGITEALRAGSLPASVAQERLQRELAAVEALLAALAHDLGTYGRAEVRTALEAGAVETLLLLQPETRTRRGRRLLALAEQQRAAVVEVSPHHLGGETLAGLGGAAAVLRYRVG